MDNLVSWLYDLTNSGSPYFTIYNFLIQTTIYLSITAVFILLFKLIFKNRLPAKWHVAIWALLLIRFVVPTLPSSPMSVFNTAKISDETIQQSSRHEIVTHINGQEIDNLDTNNYTVAEGLQAMIEQEHDDNSYSESISYSGFTVKIDAITTVVWAGGTAIMLLYFVIIFIIYLNRLKKNRRECDELTLEILTSCKEALGIKRQVKIYHADVTPMLIGIIKPAIYLPDSYTDIERRDVILHELCHMKNFDILWSAIATLVLCLNWFNPIIWFSFFMFKRDIEVFCDERTLRHSADKQSYARLLLKTATARKEKFVLGTTSLQSGKADVKRRIRYMALFKKPAVITVTAAVFAVSIISVCCLTNSMSPKSTFTFIDDLSGERYEITIDNEVLDIGDGQGNFLFGKTNLDIEEIADRLRVNNRDITFQILNDKELVIRFFDNDSFQPRIVVTKNVVDTSGNELDNIVVISYIGENLYTFEDSDVCYSTYLPCYYIEDCFVYDTNDNSMYSTKTYENPFSTDIKLKEGSYGDFLGFYVDIDGYSFKNYDSYADHAGRTTVINKVSGEELFDIHYNSEENTVRFTPYPALKAEYAKNAIYRYFNAIKYNDAEAYVRCKNYNADIYFTMKWAANDIGKFHTAELTKIIGGADNGNGGFSFNVFCNLAYEDSYPQEGVNMYSKHFEVEIIDGEPKIVNNDMLDKTGEYYKPNFIDEVVPISYTDTPYLSDIEEMNVGTEMPKLIYADESKAIISSFDCGIIVYDMENKKIDTRVPAEFLRNLGVALPYGIASGNGNKVYISDGMMNLNGDSESDSAEYKSYVLVVDEKTLYNWDGFNHYDTPSVFNPKRLFDDENEVVDKYSDYIQVDPEDKSYVGNTVVEIGDSFIFLDCNGWKMKNLHINKFNTSNNEIEITGVFR